ncbi:MAG: P-type conjugative transfer protein TrbG [Alphaproteobacteria bacterium HGW-Alphaproteobacteria-18]|nr:MAG: P-type conjugative transfer protein TrbG [Alphaproteobacteria bacterium HGW-Alphaproteobacteria-18]
MALEEPKPERVEIVETAIALPLPGQLKPVEPETTKKTPQSPAATIKEGRAGAVIEPSPEGFLNAVQVYPYTEGALYRLYASPGQVTDIALQPGETLVSVSAGDTVRWIVGDTASGSGSAARAHILVKPVAAGLQTNLMIATDRRTYHLELESTPATYMAALSWRYPQDELAGLTARNADAAAQDAVPVERGLSLETLAFDYRITGDSPDWKPVRVFDDGRQVFIQMPAGIAAAEMPPLFVLSSAGKAELVNYRVRGTYYIVDRLFAAAELRHGTKPQTVVRITKTSGAPRPRWRRG